MPSFKECIAEDGVDYFVIEMPENQVPKLALINEGKWVASGKKDWMVRVDAENPSINQQRHVHTARSKHTNTKAMQASWNQNGTRHDSKSFNSKIGSLSVVQSIARQALNLPDDIHLEELSRPVTILIKLNETVIAPIMFSLKNTKK